MIHIIKEGECGHIGLNIKYDWCWIAFSWIMYNPSTYTLKNWYIRFRLKPVGFKIITDIHEGCVIDTYLFDTGMKLCTREEYEDYIIPKCNRASKYEEYISDQLTDLSNLVVRLRAIWLTKKKEQE